MEKGMEEGVKRMGKCIVVEAVAVILWKMKMVKEPSSRMT